MAVSKHLEQICRPSANLFPAPGNRQFKHLGSLAQVLQYL
jgi:hypothetical protein